MHLTREDRLRELELLPVWHVRTGASASELLQNSASAIVTPVTIESVKHEEMHSAVLAAPEMLSTDSLDEAKTVVEDHTVKSTVVSEPMIQSVWLLYSQPPVDTHSQRLLLNIQRALQLPEGDVVSHHQPLQISQIDSRFCVIFGLDAANQFLSENYTDLSAVRGQLHVFDKVFCVVTHDLQAMLHNASLKKEVWQDLCLLLAKKNEESA